MVKVAEDNNRLTLGELWFFFFPTKEMVFGVTHLKAMCGVCKGLETCVDLHAWEKICSLEAQSSL